MHCERCEEGESGGGGGQRSVVLTPGVQALGRPCAMACTMQAQRLVESIARARGGGTGSS